MNEDFSLSDVSLWLDFSRIKLNWPETPCIIQCQIVPCFPILISFKCLIVGKKYFEWDRAFNRIRLHDLEVTRSHSKMKSPQMCIMCIKMPCFVFNGIFFSWSSSPLVMLIKPVIFYFGSNEKNHLNGRVEVSYV